MMTNLSNQHGSSSDDVRRAYSDIRRLWLFSAVPVVVTVVTFIALLASNSVDTSSQYILVLYEATRLLVPLQVAALVAPWNIGHIMKLCSYWVGYRASMSRYWNHGVSTVSDEQGTITSHLFFASPMTALMALWHACKPTESSIRGLGLLRHFPGGPRSELGEYLTLTTSVLSVVAFSHLLFVGLVTLLAALASMETHDIITPVKVPMQHFGRVLPDRCLDTKGMSNGVSYSCGVEPVTGGFVLTNSTESIRTVNNASSLNQVLYDSQNQIALLAPKDINGALDYSSKTLGVSTQCRSKGKECRLRLSSINNTGVVHFCPPDESAGDDYLSVGKAWAGNVILGPGRTPNPFNYWVWSVVDKTETHLSSDSEVVKMVGGAISILLDCSVNVYNVTYSVQNGTIVPETLIATMADDAPSYVVADPLALNFAQNQIYESLRLAAVTSRNASEVASKVSVSVSEMAVAYLAGIFEPLQNEEESTRRAVQVARLPMALVCITIALGISLALQATCFFLIAMGLVRKDPNTVVERDRLTLEARVSGAVCRDPVERPGHFPKD
ncbi:hypothetical protein NCS57_00907700 [Fusarium keratoplasticum]|uniref:Uncharacterized protein n=1 Tax=Fusarium keratoplasticum TaxID=1328300 RepID=A0ACC0QUT2_9HYPO|nr:hypothetical protein NCS57_00907700 [Fusarium keratoplasticum]KAI8666808.1 hypothetical protein NCS57_00907700 [Fusarium keratoplasticum]